MIEQHYSDEALLTLLDTRGADSVLGDPHLASCEMCSDALDSYRDIAGLLCDKDVWDEDESYDLAPAPESLSRIRAFADSVAREDAEAETLVGELLEMPTEWWAEEVRNDERYATAGVVRRLVAVAYEVVTSIPQQALVLTDIAVELAGLLDSTKYETNTREMLRGVALREHGFALTYLGRDHEAMAATQRATAAFELCVGAEVEIARNKVLMAIVQRQLEQYDVAVESARSAAAVFTMFGLDTRRRAAEWAEANVLVTSGRHREAIERFRKLESEAGNRPGELAGIIVNTAYCYSELREYDRALPQFMFALGVYEDMGNRAEAARVSAFIAGVFAGRGDIAEAEKRYRTAKTRLEASGLAREAALVHLSLAELALATNRFVEAESCCRSVIGYFETITEPTSSKALEALSYLREAVAQRRASAAVAEAVRRYVNRLPQQPNLLFAPPPLP